MATKLYFHLKGASGEGGPGMHRGTNSAKLNGSASGWENPGLISTAKSSVGVQSASALTVAGATNGVEVMNSGLTLPLEWVSLPVDADVTISGTITLNLWAWESGMNANVAINAVVDKIAATDGTITQIVKTARTTEVALSPGAVNNFTATPTSTALNKGDRIRVRVFGDDAGTMGSGFDFTFKYGGATDGADGDSWIQFNENFGFMSGDKNSGNYLMLRDTAASGIGAGVDSSYNKKELAIGSYGASQATSVTNTAAGYGSPINITDTAGGSPLEWFTKPLQAFTLDSFMGIFLDAKQSNAAANASLRAELAVCDSDGSNPVVWSTSSGVSQGTFGSDDTGTGELNTTDDFFGLWLAGDDYSVADGKRLRLRIFIDDTSQAAMASGHTVTVYYNSSNGTVGDSHIESGRTYAEYSSGVTQTAQIATIAFTGVAGTLSAGAATKTAQIASLGMTAVANVPTGGPITKTAQVANLALTAIPGVESVVVTKPAQVATLGLTALQVIPTGGPATQTAQIANLGLTALPNVPTAGPATLAAQIANLAFTAVPVVPSSPPPTQTQTAQIASLVLTALANVPTAGPATVTAQVAALAFTALANVPSAGPATKTSQVATLAMTALAGVLTRTETQIAQIAQLLFTGVAGVKTTGPATQAAQIAALALTALPVVPTGGPVTLAAQVANLTLTAIPIVPDISGGAAQTKTAQLASLVLTAIPVVPTGGPATKQAQIGLLTLTAVPVVPTGGPATKNAQIATLGLTAIPVIPTGGPSTKTAQIANLLFTALAGNKTTGAATLAAQIAQLAFTAVPITPLVSGSQIAQVANIAFTALPGVLTAGEVTRQAQVANLLFTGIPGVLSNFNKQTAQVAQLQFIALPGVPSGGAATVAAQIALLQFLAVSNQPSGAAAILRLIAWEFYLMRGGAETILFRGDKESPLWTGVAEPGGWQGIAEALYRGYKG